MNREKVEGPENIYNAAAVCRIRLVGKPYSCCILFVSYNKMFDF